ncbi:carboxypeptidase-like regulatory domain-containing protein [Hymenobacter cellulosilyticus]|uniref:Carboxypeptidase-like regulatory domain-containing protein n=1 Tax=Hymenobacter cellulosilyticus TaxID=2932248 RepID=A0A8T9Q7J5_9BACT|nr:carboxypeptidase-like regulatory domain-containing protein [Hymenobacter cellulosilyticus]UOQ71479.1 carboxypeptidase-like regulatory domain-containing protein [Hymenobacter cellulosilyticus]
MLLPSSAQAVSAQTLDGQPRYQATGLRTMIKAQPNSALVRVRYESNNPGVVHVELLNDKRRVVYTERKRETHFVGDYNLAFLPAGDYTLHLSTNGFHHVEALRLNRNNNSIATVQVIELNAFQVYSQSLFPSAVTN